MFLGIDLAGDEKNITGMAFINEKVILESLHSDNEILEFIEKHSPEVIAIDAPLSFYGEHFRECDLELRKEFKILPLTFKGMQKLTKRGISLKKKIGEKVIETYPHASRKKLKDELKKYTFKNKHEEDALICALVAKAYYFKEAEYYGEKDRIYVI
ncbi:hypothetical protein DRN50_02790 [Thermococci archaeon]|nr:MAG: hypothetical protein DRN50_02790 [Thermococci archaeon]